MYSRAIANSCTVRPEKCSAWSVETPRLGGLGGGGFVLGHVLFVLRLGLVDLLLEAIFDGLFDVLPELAGLLPDLSDLGLVELVFLDDTLAVLVEPQEVRGLGALGGVGVLLLFLAILILLGLSRLDRHAGSDFLVEAFLVLVGLLVPGGLLGVRHLAPLGTDDLGDLTDVDLAAVLFLVLLHERGALVVAEEHEGGHRLLGIVSVVGAVRLGTGLGLLHLLGLFGSHLLLGLLNHVEIGLGVV